MTISPESRGLLPVAATPHYARGKRSAATCRWKCADACAHPAPNVSANEYFRDVAAKALSRRVLLGGMAAAAGAVVLGGGALAGAAPAAAAPLPGHGPGHGRKGLSFGPIDSPDWTVDDVVVPDGFEWSPIIRWGDPILPGGRPFDVTAQSPEQQARQFGYNVDYLDILPSDPRHLKNSVVTRRGRRGLLVTNHEYTNREIMFDDSYDPATRRAIERAAHGMSVVEVVRKHTGGPWDHLRIAPRNRRIHMDTEFTIDGPAAGHELLRTAEDPTGTTVRGTLNNCAGGTTPWGTVLSGEENWHGYFKVAGDDPRETRYGLSNSDTQYGWELDEPRFDATRAGYANEPHRFGWIVELDPYDPDATPVKHTALGRFKHEGANVIVAPDGRVVAYMGDDERFDYVYKFVSRNRMRDGHDAATRAYNKTLLSEGDLYVAKFTGDSPAEEFDGSGKLPSDGAFDGAGEWLPLVVDGRSAVPGMSVAEVLLFTRLAGDAVGATKMDRPEDVEPSPFTGNVYVACTNNSDRGTGDHEGATEPNPRAQNRDGHVVEIVEGDQTSTTFAWTLLLVAGDPSVNGSTYFSGYPPHKVSPISCPDNLAFDTDGALWISTDGQPGEIQKCDGLFRVTLHGPERGRVEQFLSVPRGAETCGPLIDVPDRMVYVNVQHPGDGGTFDDPGSYFPDYIGEGEEAPVGSWRGPRPATVQVYRKRGHGPGPGHGGPGHGGPGHGGPGHGGPGHDRPGNDGHGPGQGSDRDR